MSSIDMNEEQLPPLWGKSFWWTRAGALIGLVALLWGIFMASLLATHLGSCGLQNQLTNPNLASELAGAWEDMISVVGPCQAVHCKQSADQSACFASGGCRTICPDKVDSLSRQQYFDYAFIVTYWLFFLYLGLINWQFCHWQRLSVLTQVLGKAGGVVTIAAASYAAFADWHENQSILQALNELHLMAGPVPVIRDFAYTKWKLLFIALGAASPVFLFWSGRSNKCDVRPSAFSHALAGLTALVALSTAWTGVAACIYGDDPRLEVATRRLGLVILSATLTLATAQYWRGGTLAALNRLAHLPVLRFFANLFSNEDDSPQT